MGPAILLIVLVVIGAPIAVLVAVFRVRERTLQLERRVEDLTYQLAQIKRESTPAAPKVVAPIVEVKAPVLQPVPLQPVTEPVSHPVPPPLPQRAPLTQPAPLPIIVPAASATDSQSEPAAPVEAAAGNGNWEQFLGAKLFAWVGGLALFMGVAFFIKYSFEHNLIPPWLRVLAGFGLGIGLVVGGGMITRRREYQTLAQTLTATGIVILYAVSFAARSAYHLINAPVLFTLMLSITATAFTLALRMNAQVVAVLGILGGFLTPFLLGGKSDQPFGLFGYILFLNAGLLAVAHYRKWKFLISLGSLASFITAIAWTVGGLTLENAGATLLMYVLVCAEYVASFWWTHDQEGETPHGHVAALLQGLNLWILSFCFMTPQHPAMLIASAIFIADIAILSLAWRGQLQIVVPTALVSTSVLLACWIARLGNSTSVYLLLGSLVVAGLMNGLLPLWIARKRGEKTHWASIGGIAALCLMFIAHTQLGASNWFFWPAVLLVNLVVLALAAIERNPLLATVSVVLTMILTAVWINRLDPNSGAGVPLFVIIGFALVFSAAALWLATREQPSGQFDVVESFLPAVPSFLPFFLLTQLISRVSMQQPIPVFGAVGLMDLILIGSALWLRKPELTAAALGGTLLVEHAWKLHGLNIDNGAVSLTGFVLFSLLFTAFPFVARKRNADRMLPWRVSAIAGPLHFLLIYKTVRLLWPTFENLGIVPALLSIPAFVALVLARKESDASKERIHGLTAAYGASALFFVTFIFPVQFSREWLTIGWVLEGAGLVWLYRKAPVKWLIYGATGLLSVAFIRLTFNPAVLEYHQRSGTPIFNWYLYTYGLVAAALFTAMALCPREVTILGKSVRNLFGALGTIILFLLLNIQIADYFATGSYLTFEFSGNFARDMSYSIAWSIFALALLLVGVARLAKGVRYAGIGLMLVTILKLFFHDLSQLDQRYRIGAFIGVALILMLASFIYQRFLSQPKATPKS